MRRLRPLVGAMAIAAAGMLGTYPLSVNAQTQTAPRITQGTQTAEEPMSVEDLQSIDSFTTYWVEQLASGQEANIAKARQAFRATVSPAGASPEFIKQFNKIMLKKLLTAVQAPTIPAEASQIEKDRIEQLAMLTRINAMIVLVNAQGEGIEPVLSIGLQDDNGGVRYWASKAIAKVAEYKRLTEEEQPQVLNLLETALGKETQSAALTEQLAALSNMNVGTAKEILLKVLSARVDVHAKDVLASYSPEQKALQEMFIKLIQDTERNGINAEEIKTFTSVAFRYTKLATSQINQNDNLTPEQIADKREMIRLGDRILRFAHNNIDPGARSPQKIDGALIRSDWKFIQVTIDQWIKILTKSPFNMNESELK